MWGNCREFFGQREIRPLVSIPPSFTTRWSHIPLIGPQLNSTYRSRRREKEGGGGEGGIEGKLRSFSPRPFSLCALSSGGLFLKLVGMAWYTALAHFTSNSSPSDRQRDFKSTFILLSLLALGPKGRTHVSLTFFLITPINFPSVGTEEDGCTARRVIFIEWIIQRDYAFFFCKKRKKVERLRIEMVTFLKKYYSLNTKQVERSFSRKNDNKEREILQYRPFSPGWKNPIFGNIGKRNTPDSLSINFPSQKLKGSPIYPRIGRYPRRSFRNIHPSIVKQFSVFARRRTTRKTGAVTAI